VTATNRLKNTGIWESAASGTSTGSWHSGHNINKYLELDQICIVFQVKEAS
jgi:hypothetical protein